MLIHPKQYTYSNIQDELNFTYIETCTLSWIEVLVCASDRSSGKEPLIVQYYSTTSSWDILCTHHHLHNTVCVDRL